VIKFSTITFLFKCYQPFTALVGLATVKNTLQRFGHIMVRNPEQIHWVPPYQRGQSVKLVNCMIDRQTYNTPEDLE